MLYLLLGINNTESKDTMKEQHNTSGERPSNKLNGRVPARSFFYKAAVFVDGDFFIRRLKNLNPDIIDDPKLVAQRLFKASWKHALRLNRELYRIFFYDCSPFERRLHYPISNHCIDFKKSEVYKFRTQLHAELRKTRKCALRLGKIILDQNTKWLLKDSSLQALIKKEKSFDDLKDEDFIPNLRQKQVDMKIGVDITTLALQKRIDTIILISGDSDFAPAAKLARVEGIDFILDPMRCDHIQDDLFEHVDGIHSVFVKQNIQEESK